MSAEKTMWVHPLHFKSEVKVDIDHVIEKLIDAMEHDHEIYYMKATDLLRKKLTENPLREILKFKTLEEEQMLEEFLTFIENKRKGLNCELKLKS
jgi:hypothetical protein